MTAHVSVFWLVVGAFIGFDTAMAYVWLSARRTRKQLEMRWRVLSYTAGTRRPW